MKKSVKCIMSAAVCLAVAAGSMTFANFSKAAFDSTAVYAEEAAKSGNFKNGLSWSYKNRVFEIEGSGTLNEQEYLNIRGKYDVGAVVVGKNVILPLIDDEAVKLSLFIQREADEAFSHSKLYSYKDSDTQKKTIEMAQSLADNDKARGVNVSAQDYLNRYVVNVIADDADPFSVECTESIKNAELKTGTLEKGNAVWSYKNRVLVIDGKGLLDETEFTQLRSKLDVGAVVIDRGVQLPVIKDEDVTISLFIQREAVADFCNSYLYTYSGSDVEKVQHEMAKSFAENDRKNKGINTTEQDYLNRFVVNIIADGVDPFAVECKTKKEKLPTVKNEVIDGMLCTYIVPLKRLTITGEGEFKKSTLDALMDKYDVDTVTFLGEMTLENNELLKTVTNANGTKYSVYTYKDSPICKQYYQMLDDEEFSTDKYVLNVIDDNSSENTQPVITTASTVPQQKTSTTATTAVAPETVLGDADGNNRLDVRDCAFIANSIAKGKAESLPDSADYNKDGKKDVRDAAAVARSLANSVK